MRWQIEPGSFLIPARRTRIEQVVVNSRFIATATPAFSIDEARAFIAAIRHEFADATHNVPAYLIGHGASVVAHCHDDGEPSGTAGRPMLAMLQGSGLGDVAVVVTRYFGGTKLGTGGLVRAYGDAARQVLAALPRAVKMTTHTVMLTVPYPMFERVRLLAAAHGGEVLEQDFGVEVTVLARFPAARLDGFQDALSELSNGALTAEIFETNPATIVPVELLVERDR